MTAMSADERTSPPTSRPSRLPEQHRRPMRATWPDGVTTTGVDAIDLWIGGLAERQMPFGGLLGSTFNFVFETQLEALQNGDRFYYLARLAGLNFLTELENNSFAKLSWRTPTPRICRPTCSRRRPSFSRSTRRAVHRSRVRRPTTIRPRAAPTSRRSSFATTRLRRAPTRTTSSTPAETMSCSAAPTATTS